MRGLIIITLFWYIAFCNGATITAVSCSLLDVSNSVANASQGDTIIVPSGNATWTDEIRVSYKSIRIIFAEIGQTTITRDTTGSNSKRALFFLMDTTNTCYLSGATWRTVNPATFGIIGWGTAGPFKQQSIARFTRLKVIYTPSGAGISASGSRGITISGAYGVIDHCWLESTNASGGQMITIDTDNNASTSNTWHTVQSLGDTNCVCIEDCVFSGFAPNDGAIDMYVGMKATVRYFISTNTNFGTHGYDSSIRSSKSLECYMGQIYNTGTQAAPGYAFKLRGGTGVFWSNTVINISGTGIGSGLTHQYYRADTNCISLDTCPSICNGSSLEDGNFDSYGYPGLDQSGRGSFSVSSTWKSGAASYATNDYEALEPVYQWNNTIDGTNWLQSVTLNPGQDTNYVVNPTRLIQPNRDYYDNIARPGYAPLSYPHPLVVAQDGNNTPRTSRIRGISLMAR